MGRGVSQGSVLGPLFFLMYINDFINARTKFKFMMYADDTSLLISDKNLHSLHRNLMSELQKVKLWVQANKLKMNISKTNFILFQNRSIKNSIPPVCLDEEIIKQVSHAKVIIDENLNWKTHIDKICLKISKLKGILYKIRHNLTTESMISIYYTLCYPHLIYCVPIWVSTWSSFTKKLSIAKKKNFRCIFFFFKCLNQQIKYFMIRIF